MEIEQRVWGFTPEGEAVVVYTMRNDDGTSVELTNMGAAIVSVVVPGRDGLLADVALGYSDLMSYRSDGPAMGKTVGRYANRIANGRFTLDGVEYQLARNNGHNALHGGPMGFGNRIWDARVEVNRVVFSLLSTDGDEGYPGEVGVEVVYDWGSERALEITYIARAASDTIINLTNHAYFNLAGHDAGPQAAMAQTLQLNAEKWLPTDRTQIPTGDVAKVKNTPMDFRTAKPLGQDIDADVEALKIGNGYDHCWVVDHWEKRRVGEVGTLVDPASGRAMKIFSSQPGVQVYTGNWLAGCPAGKGGVKYADRAGVAIECQGFPDAPNKPDFPSQVLREGEIYEEKIVYLFTTR